MTAPDDRPPLRIAFGGRMRVGKTTAADRLVAVHGFVKTAIADPIKRIASAGFGWDGAKDRRGRRLLQEIGTIGRTYDPDLWLDGLARRLDGWAAPRIVVDDLRLSREVPFLQRLGFVCVRITCPPAIVVLRSPRSGRAEAGAGRDGHETEGELDGMPFEHEIDNAGTIEELHRRVDGLLARLAAEERRAAPGSLDAAGPNRKAPL